MSEPVGTLTFTWNPKDLEIRTYSVEKTLEPLVQQVTTLVNTKGPSKKKKGKSKRAHVLVAAVDKATQKFIEKGEEIAHENPEVKKEMLATVDEVRKTGENMRVASSEFADDPCSSAKRSNMVRAARALLSAVTRLLILADMVDVQLLIRNLKIVEADLRNIRDARSEQELANKFKAYAEDASKLNKLTGSRQADLKDAGHREKLAAARADLQKHGNVLLTSSKAYIRHPEVAAARENKEYVIKQLSDAVNTISDVAQATGKSEPDVSLAGPGELAAALEELDREVLMSPADYKEKRTRPSLEEKLEGIISAAALMADSSCTRDDTRERIIAECNNVRQALQDLLSEYMSCAGRKERTDPLDRAIERMFKKTRDLRRQLRKAVVDHISDSFLETNLPLLVLIEAAKSGNVKEVEEYAGVFQEHADKLVEVANLACSMSQNEEGVKYVRMAAQQLENLCPQVINAARILAARPRSKAALDNMEAFRQQWEKQVRLLTEAVDEITTLDDFLAVSEKHILEDVSKCNEALRERDGDKLDRCSGAIRGRSSRVCHVVESEMQNYVPSQYTDRVLRAVDSLRDQVMPRFAREVENSVDALTSQPPGHVDDNEFMDAAKMVYDGVREIRRAVLVNRDDDEDLPSDADELYDDSVGVRHRDGKFLPHVKLAEIMVVEKNTPQRPFSPILHSPNQNSPLSPLGSKTTSVQETVVTKVTSKPVRQFVPTTSSDLTSLDMSEILSWAGDKTKSDTQKCDESKLDFDFGFDFEKQKSNTPQFKRDKVPPLPITSADLTNLDMSNILSWADDKTKANTLKYEKPKLDFDFDFEKQKSNTLQLKRDKVPPPPPARWSKPSILKSPTSPTNQLGSIAEQTIQSRTSLSPQSPTSPPPPLPEVPPPSLSPTEPVTAETVVMTTDLQKSATLHVNRKENLKSETVVGRPISPVSPPPSYTTEVVNVKYRTLPSTAVLNKFPIGTVNENTENAGQASASFGIVTKTTTTSVAVSGFAHKVAGDHYDQYGSELERAAQARYGAAHGGMGRDEDEGRYLYGPDGRPIIGPDGRPLFIAPDGALVDSQGRPITIDNNGYLVDAEGRPICGPDGKPIMIDPQGRLLTSDGYALVGPDNKPVMMGEDGRLYGSDGRPLISITQDGRLVGADGKALPIGAGGAVIGAYGRPIMTADGHPLTIAADGKLLDPEGRPISIDSNGRLVGPDGRPILGADGKPMYVDSQGRLLGSDGRPIIGLDGRPIMISADGMLLGADGRPITGWQKFDPLRAPGGWQPYVESDDWSKADQNRDRSRHAEKKVQDTEPEVTREEILAQFTEAEKQQIQIQVEEFELEKEKFEKQVIYQWDDTGNDIIIMAKQMCMIMMEMTDFTRGRGPLKTTMDVIHAARRIADLGSKLDKLARTIADMCPDSTSKDDLIAYLQRIALYCHQLNICSKVKAGVQSVSGELVVSALDSATSLIQAAKNLMSAVVQTVKASYVASTKYSRHGGSVKSPVVLWKMKAPDKKPLVKRESPDEMKAKIHKAPKKKDINIVQELNEFKGSDSFSSV
ncbi:catenin alpha-2-like isoform X1 [Ptychodera flava]|uniref:catenin alpha-2-like isoform X1 n=1 Tax=Ptychodera flava TaxID=63121 RepID=UPI00396AAD69